MSDLPITTQCVYTTDPHSVIVYVGPFLIGQFDLNQYEQIKGTLNLPDVVCDGPTSI